MSTKCTLAYGQGFHLYQDALDADNVYFQLENTHFEASYNRVLLPIPVHIWEYIRRFPGTSFEYANKTDAQLRQDVEAKVDARLKRADVDAQNSLSRLFDLVPLGSPDLPREQQIANGIAYFSEMRETERQKLTAIVELESINKPHDDNTLTTYDADTAAWAKQQADFLRMRRFDLLDIEHLADQIERMSKST